MVVISLLKRHSDVIIVVNENLPIAMHKHHIKHVAAKTLW